MGVFLVLPLKVLQAGLLPSLLEVWGSAEIIWSSMYVQVGRDPKGPLSPAKAWCCASLGSLFQPLTTFPVKTLFLMFNLNSP